MTNSQNAITSIEQVASTYAESIIHSIQQEYPNQMQHMMTGPDDRPTRAKLTQLFMVASIGIRAFTCIGR